jgi:glycosyltransferase involved in cell wall biosynthesis
VLSANYNGQKILVLGPEIRNPHHRGIYVYTKSLFAALKSLGFKTGFLTQTSLATDQRALLEQIVFGLANPAKLDWMRARKTWMKSEYKTGMREIRNDLLVLDPKWHFLSSVDYLLNVPCFFDALEFGATCAQAAPNDFAAQLSNSRKRASGELENNAVDIDFVASAGYKIIITSSPTPIRSHTGEVKIVQTVHDLIPVDDPLGRDDPGNFINSVTSAMRYADRIIAMSKYTASSLINVFPEHAEKCSVVYQANPIEALLKRSHQDSDQNINWLKSSGVEQHKYFLYIGALERRKNIEVIVRAFLMLNRERDFKLLLAGPANEFYVEETGLERYLQSAQARADGVIYAGYVSDEHKAALLQNAVAFVFPSIIEGFGLPVLEAMSVGCPVITTRGSSIPEVGADAVAYIDDPYNVSALSKLMSQLVTDKTLSADLRDKGLLRAEHFTVRAFAERLHRWGAQAELFCASQPTVTKIEA